MSQMIHESYSNKPFVMTPTEPFLTSKPNNDNNDLNNKVITWKIAFRVEFRVSRLGLTLHASNKPDTGHGVYTIQLSNIDKSDDTNHAGAAQQYNERLRPNQEHLKLREGLYLTHINNDHMINQPANIVIDRIRQTDRPLILRFIDAEAGIILQNNITKDTYDKPQLPNINDYNNNNNIYNKDLNNNLCLSSVPEETVLNNNKDNIDLFKKKSLHYSNLLNNMIQPSNKQLNNNHYNNTILSDHSSFVTNLSKSTFPPLIDKTQDKIYKIILLGAQGVGKSSLLSVGIEGDGGYTERRPATLEAEFASMYIPNPDITKSEKIKIRIWDTAGQERFSSITKQHYRGADGAILVYDVLDSESFEKLKGWYHKLKEIAGSCLKSVMVIGNKIDQLPDKIKNNELNDLVDENKVSEYCKLNGFLFVLASAKMNKKCYKWKGQKIEDSINQLALNVHATALSREKIFKNEIMHIDSRKVIYPNGAPPADYGGDRNDINNNNKTATTTTINNNNIKLIESNPSEPSTSSVFKGSECPNCIIC